MGYAKKRSALATKRKSSTRGRARSRRTFTKAQVDRFRRTLSTTYGVAFLSPEKKAARKAAIIRKYGSTHAYYALLNKYFPRD